MRRFFVKEIEDTVLLVGDDHKYLSKVLRLKMGDSVVLFCGDGYEYFGKIVEILPSSTKIEIEKKVVCAAEPRHEVMLFQAMPKGEKAELVVQKATELGLSGVVFFDSEFSVKKGNAVKTERFFRIAAEAARQCGRASFPKIEVGKSFEGAINTLKNFDLRLFAYERERDNSLVDILSQNNILGRVGFLIGSEGGISDSEVKLLHDIGAKSVGLGRRILRTETAAIAAATIVMAMLGELK